MAMYKDVMGTLVRVLAADNIDNSTKQSWQKLIDADLRQGGTGSTLSVRDKFDYDCCLYALLHRQLDPAQWDVLVAKYSTHKANKVGAGTLGKMVGRDLYTDQPLVIGPGKMTAAEKKHVWENQDLYRNRISKYRYSPYGVKDLPRFPRHIVWRDPVDMS